MRVVDVDDDLLDRLQPLARARVLSVDDLRARHGQLEAFAAHVLDEDGELQLAAAGDVVGVLIVGFADADGDVALRLLAAAARG